MGETVEFSADDVAREAGGQQRTIERGEFALIDFAAEEAEFAFDALANECGGIGLFGGFFHGGFDVAVRDAAGAQVAGDAEVALFAGLGAKARELARVAGVIDQIFALQTVDHGLDELFVFAAAPQGLVHFMDGVGAAHKDFDSGVVELRFGVELAGLAEHGGRIEVRK